MCRIDTFYIALQSAGPIVSLYETVKLKNKLQMAPNAPEIVKQFCYEKLKAQGLNHDQVMIKIVDDAWLASFGQNYIMFSPAAAFELKTALENNDQKKSVDTVKIFSIFLDHEIGHLKNNDSPTKSLSAYAGSSLFCIVLSTAIMLYPRYRYLFEKTSKPSDEYTVQGSCITYPQIIVSFGAQLLSLFLSSRYVQFQEKRADSYAIALSTDPDGLRSTADFLERNEDGLVDQLVNAKFDESSRFKSVVMIGLRRTFLTFYKLQKTNEDFHSWVKRQPLSSSLVRFFWDIEHPSGYYRAQVMRLAADALEASSIPPYRQVL